MRYWKPQKISGEPVVGIGVASWIENEDCRRAHALSCLISSFQSQTWPHWRLHVYHDGPYCHGPGMLRFMNQWDREERVTIIETDVRKKLFGHPWRQKAINDLAPVSQWLLLTNDDNYYMPTFLEWMLSAGEKASFVYCDCVHSHKLWKHFKTQPKYRHLDLGGFIVKSHLAKKVPFDKTTFNADGDWINRLVAMKPKIAKVPATLYVHN